MGGNDGSCVLKGSMEMHMVYDSGKQRPYTSENQIVHLEVGV